MRGHFAEGRAWLERPLAADAPAKTAPIPPVLLARAHAAAGLFALDQGDLAAAQAHCETSVTLWRALETDPEHEREARGALILAIARLFQVRTAQGDRSGEALLLPEILARFQTLADPWFDAYLAFNAELRAGRRRGVVRVGNL